MNPKRMHCSIFQGDLLLQMKHRSRLLSIAVAPMLFSRPARNFFQNDATLRANNVLTLVSNNALHFCSKWPLGYDAGR